MSKGFTLHTITEEDKIISRDLMEQIEDRLTQKVTSEQKDHLIYCRDMMRLTSKPMGAKSMALLQSILTPAQATPAASQ